ncbi:hypothetical protein AGABI1DRAFT_85889, partial [Agaricus bisporus var. burnettii JB137-S8]
MGAPSKFELQAPSSTPLSAQDPAQPATAVTGPGGFPHDYIEEKGYTLSPVEEQLLCTVYQQAPPENHPNLKRSLASFIDWRCTSGVNENCPNAGTLHLCNHINGGIPDVDKELLSGFTETVKNDGVLRMDLLWSMASYNTWFQLPSDSDEDS